MKWRLRIHRALCICSHPTSCYPTTSTSVFLSFSFPAPPHHHSLANIVFLSSQYMPIQLQLLVFCTFLNISPTFAIPLILSFLLLSSLVTPLIQFGHILCLLHCPWLGSVHYCWCDNRFVHFPLDPQSYSSIT